MRSLLLLTFLLVGSIGVFAQSNSITGRVTYGDDTPLHGATVRITQTRQSAETGDDGTYSLTGISPGRYNVLVHIDGFSDQIKQVDITDGSQLTLDFSMRITSLQEQVTVTASGVEQATSDAFQSVSTVSSAKVMEKNPASLGEVLDGEPGVAKRSFGPGSGRPVIRGFDGDRVLVLQDGVRVGSLGSQSGDHGEPVDALGAERIEVLKGPATLLYGSNAIGGVVNVIDHHENDFHSGFRGYGSFVGATAEKQAGFAGGVEYGIKNWMFGGDLGFQRTGDYKTPIGRIENSSSRGANGGFQGGYFARKGWVRGSFSSNISRYGVPYAGEFHAHSHEEGEEEEELQVDIRMRNYNYNVTGGFRDLDNSFIRGVQYSLRYTDYRHKEIEIGHHHEDGIDEEEEVATIFANKTFSYRTMFEQAAHKNLSGRFGVEGFSRDFEVAGEEQLINGPVKHNSISAFVLQELNYERFKFQFGGRVENNRYRVSDPELRDRSFTGFSGAAGINVGLWQGGSFVTNYTFSSRAPSLEELYNNGPHIGNLVFEEGNNDLDLETSHGFDIGLRHTASRFRLSGDLFYYRINNFTYLAIEDEHQEEGEIHFELPHAEYLQDKAEYFGAEVTAEADFNKYVGGFITLDAIRAKLIDLDLNVPRIPPARARLGLDLRYRSLSVRPEVLFAAKQDRVYEEETPTGGYGILNVAASYVVGQKHLAHIFSVNAYNLTDRLYRNHVSFIKDLVPEVGRGVRFGYTIRFF